MGACRQVMQNPPLSYLETSEDAMFSLFDVLGLSLSSPAARVTRGRGKLSGYHGDGHLPSL